MLILISPLLKRLLAEQICIFLTSQLIIIKNLAKPPNPLPPAILTYPLPSPKASARSPNSSEHSERSTGAADLQGAARSTISSEHSERSTGEADLQGAARSTLSSEHSERSTGAADLQGAARSTNSSEHRERSTGVADLNLSLSITYGVPDDAWRHGVFDECHSSISPPLTSKL